MAEYVNLASSDSIGLIEKHAVRKPELPTTTRQVENRLQKLRYDLAHMERLKMMGEMAGGLAHELNQPLAAIVMQAEVAAQKIRHGLGISDQERLDLLEFIGNEAYRAGQIIRHMKQFVKNSEPCRAFVRPGEIIDEVIPLARNELREASVALTADLDSSLPAVLADKIQIQQVLLNLVRNAVEAIEDAAAGAGRVDIAARVRHGMLEISVADNGHGIPEGPMDDLFKSFYSTKPDGTGLGLAISRTIIQAHGGRIWGKRNGEGGSTFAFTLPIAAGENEK
jgi:C4-dicarboxylate-specific signal transduction histidine kinase